MLTLPRSPSTPRREPTPTLQPLRALGEAGRFIRRTPMVWGLLVLDLVATLFASAVDLLPMDATGVLALDVGEYGMLASGVAVSALCASGVLVRLTLPRRPGRISLVAGLAFGIATIGLGLSEQFWPAVVGLAGLGAADTVGSVLVVAAIWGVQVSVVSGGLLCVLGVALVGLAISAIRSPVDPETVAPSPA